MAQYLKPDSELGYVEDSAQIGFLKFNNLRHSILDCMLGDFNEVGDYIVSPGIVAELIAMEKYIVQTYDNIELCKGVLKLDRQIAFMVTFEGNKATLSLVEKMNYEANFSINGGTYSNINEFVLDSIETSGEINRNVVYDRWNISPFGGQVVDIFNCDDSVLEKYFGIVNRFKYLLDANKILLDKEEELEEIEAGYTNEMFEILKRYPKFETVVLGTIKQTLIEKKDAVSAKKPFFAKTFNEVLENAIEQNLNSLEEKEKKQFETEKHNAVLNLNIKREDAIEVEQQMNEELGDKESAPKIYALKTFQNNDSKTVAELGEDFVSSHKTVLERISKKHETENLSSNSEKDKLLTMLISNGLAESVDIVVNKKETTQTIAGVTSNNVATPTKEQTNKTNVKASSSGGGNKNTTNNKKPSSSKPEKQKPKTPEKKKTEEVKKTGEVANSTRLFMRQLGVVRRFPANTDSNVQPAETLVKKRKDHNAEVGMVKTDVLKSKINTKPVGAVQNVDNYKENQIDVNLTGGI